MTHPERIAYLSDYEHKRRGPLGKQWGRIIESDRWPESVDSVEPPFVRGIVKGGFLGMLLGATLWSAIILMALWILRGSGIVAELMR